MEVIKEGVSDIVYHATGINPALSILAKKKFGLSPGLASNAERTFMKRGREFYMSVSRSTWGSYNRGIMESRGGVTFVLNGEWFRRRYTAKPVNYWGNPNSRGESEDRIYAHTAYISFADNPAALVKEVHVNAISDGWDNGIPPSFMYSLDLIHKFASAANIPVYFYYVRNEKERASVMLAVRRLDKSKAYTYKQIREMNKDVSPHTSSLRQPKKENEVYPWLELFNKNEINRLSRAAAFLVYEIKTAGVNSEKFSNIKLPLNHNDYTHLKYNMAFSSLFSKFTRIILQNRNQRATLDKLFKIRRELKYPADESGLMSMVAYLVKKWLVIERKPRRGKPGPWDVQNEEFNTGLNLARHLLPQIDSQFHNEFIDWLASDGVSVSEKRIQISDLKPSQGEFDIEKINKLVALDQSKKPPIIISRDNYILDGHNRWASAKRKYSVKDIKVIQVDLNILDLIRKALLFNKSVIREDMTLNTITSVVRKGIKKINI